jgi:hypothetical protein
MSLAYPVIFIILRTRAFMQHVSEQLLTSLRYTMKSKAQTVKKVYLHLSLPFVDWAR